MPIARPTTAATRLLLVVALAVLALLLAPVADVAGDVTASAGAPAGAPAEAGATGATHAEAVSTQRRAKKSRKTRKGTKVAIPTVASGAWTTSTLTYFDGLPPQWAWSLRTAAAQWNASGVGITLVPVSDPAAAQVKVSYGDIGGSSGLATVGPASGAFVKLSDRYRTALADQYDRVEVMGVLTHELGHVLGLEHVTTGCALMGPVMDIVGCGIYDMSAPDAYRCDVVGQAALAQASRLYGGTGRPLAVGTCTVGA